MTNNQVDVIIIGAGAGGGACAWALTQQGLRVLVLEAGPAFNPERDYRLDKADWEQQRFPHKKASQGMYSFAPMQPLEAKWDDLLSWNHSQGRMNPSTRRRGAKYHHVRGVGGSTLHYSGEAHRLNPNNMQMHRRFGVAADWPLDYHELENYYQQAEKLIGVAGGASTHRPRKKPFPLPPHVPSYVSQKIMTGSQDLDLHWEPNHLAILSQPYDGRRGCNYCANCNRGCPRKDKGSTDVTFLHKAVASGHCMIMTECEVLRINTKGNDHVDAVEYIDVTGDRHRVSAPVVVLACGAVQTPRLLLLSASKQAPDGLANESGLVGKYFMESIAWNSAGLHSEQLAAYRGLPSDIICWDYNRPDAIPGVIGGCRFTPSTAEADLIGPINYAKRVIKGWGKSHKQAMRESFGKILSIAAMGESLPNKKTYIDLDPEKTDAHGLALARIHSYLEDNDLKRLRFMAKMARQILSAAGVEEIIEEYSSYDFFNSTHVFGGARMGNDPASSVTNAHGRSHRWKKLYITDASIFPSSGAGESPSLTIQALAIRTAEHIVSSRR